jgi:hypothetical protein
MIGDTDLNCINEIMKDHQFIAKKFDQNLNKKEED